MWCGVSAVSRTLSNTYSVQRTQWDWLLYSQLLSQKLSYWKGKLTCVQRVKRYQKGSMEVFNLEKNQQKEKFVGGLYNISEINIRYTVRFFTQKDIQYPLYTNNIVLEEGWRINLPASCHSWRWSRCLWAPFYQKPRMNLVCVYLNTAKNL